MGPVIKDVIQAGMGTTVSNNVQGVCLEKDVQANVDYVHLIYSVTIKMELALMGVNQDTLHSFVIRHAVMDILDKIAQRNATRHVLVVTKLTDCVILAVIQDGRGTIVNNIVIVKCLGRGVACLVDIVLSQSNATTSTEHV